MKDVIVIIDWAGNILFHGEASSPQVDKVLKANMCKLCEDGCENCDFTGYEGDFEVYWEDTNDTRNVYEYINW